MPNLKHVEVVLEIVRHVAGSTVPAKRVCMGRRSWALLGRRLPADVEQPGSIEPDIGLASPRASRCHALVLQNWLGKLFLQDIGSTHGSFLGGIQLRPNEPREWRPGVKVFCGCQNRNLRAAATRVLSGKQRQVGSTKT